MRNPFAFVLLLLALAGFWWTQHRPTASTDAVALPQIATTPTAAPPVAAAKPDTKPDTKPDANLPTQPAGNPASSRRSTTSAHTQLPAFLPAEAQHTIALIQQGGPFPHRQDGSVFGNFEGHLPRQPRGWYHEYTVVTPGARNRGTRRIITGGNPPREWYYTDDHYASFRTFQVP
jgi:guanyl-specific ribonuclease Sa